MIGIYLDVIKKRKIGYLFYIIASLIHSITFVYILIRVLAMLNKGKKKNIVLALTFVLPLLLMYSTTYLYSIFANVPIIGNTILRFRLYSIDNMGMEISSNWRMVTAVNYLLILAVAFTYEKIYQNKQKFGELFNFIFIITIMAFGFFNQRELFSRHIMILMPLGIMYFTRLKDEIFVQFPLTAYIKNSKSIIQNIAPFICLFFASWLIVFFLMTAIFYYPLGSVNFQFNF